VKLLQYIYALAKYFR